MREWIQPLAVGTSVIDDSDVIASKLFTPADGPHLAPSVSQLFSNKQKPSGRNDSRKVNRCDSTPATTPECHMIRGQRPGACISRHTKPHIMPGARGKNGNFCGVWARDLLSIASLSRSRPLLLIRKTGQSDPLHSMCVRFKSDT